MNDQYFTPPELAQAVIACATVRRVRLVADFAAGHGDLLSAARRKWHMSEMLACDIDSSCVQKLKDAEAEWSCIQCDFLDANLRNAATAIQAAIGRCDVVVLNPPFSGKGGAVTSVVTENGALRCSRAMAFVVASVPYLRRGGELIAILPASCMTSAKDRSAREFCAEGCEVVEVERVSKGAFAKSAANTVIVRMRRGGKQSRKKERRTRSASGKDTRQIQAMIVRGCVPVHRAENGLAGQEFPFVHSTDLRRAYIDGSKRAVSAGRRIVEGPAVLVARVGSPATRKCAVYVSEKPIVLSDCVIAIICDSRRDAVEVRRRLLSKWDRFANVYGGTCAPYITMEGLRGFLDECSVDTS